MIEIPRDCEKAVRLGVLDAKRHVFEDAFAWWESDQLGSVKRLLNAYSQILRTLYEDLSPNVINEIRSRLFPQNRNGVLQGLDGNM